MTLSRRALFSGIAASLASCKISPAAGDDFGKLLERGAKEILRKQVTPEKIKQTLAPLERGEIYPIKTADGWTLVAHRFPAARNVPRKPTPVILCHGLSYNALFWSLDPSCSFASYLASQGHDVWAVSLRGCGLSQKWVWKIEDAPTMFVGGALRTISGGKLAPTGYATIDPKFANWTLDQHIDYDVPAFVTLVKHHAKSNEVAWVGHSMGGIVALAHLSRYKNPGIGRLVTVGSQVTMPQGQIFLQFLKEMLITRQGQLAGKIKGKELVEQSNTSVNNLFFNERNVIPKVYEALGTWAKDVPSIGLLQQYRSLAERGELKDARGEFNYARKLKNVQVPYFIACGEGDQLAPPVVQQYIHENVGSNDKTLAFFGRSRGLSVNCGHNDSFVGVNSRAEVYPVLDRWLSGVSLASTGRGPTR